MIPKFWASVITKVDSSSLARLVYNTSTCSLRLFGAAGKSCLVVPVRSPVSGLRSKNESVLGDCNRPLTGMV